MLSRVATRRCNQSRNAENTQQLVRWAARLVRFRAGLKKSSDAIGARRCYVGFPAARRRAPSSEADHEFP
ncbi:hypothetical protein BCEP27_80211 [Burkholderia cepacia]